MTKAGARAKLDEIECPVCPGMITPDTRRCRKCGLLLARGANAAFRIRDHARDHSRTSRLVKRFLLNLQD